MHAATPIFYTIDAAGHYLDEIQVEPLVESEQGMCQRMRVVVNFWKVTPKADRRPIDRLPFDGSIDSLSLIHRNALL
jgi:hypothetical protein